MQPNPQITFVGGGNMASAMITGLFSQHAAAKKSPDSAPQILVIDKNQAALSQLSTKFGVVSHEKIDAMVEQAEVIVLAVKPQQLKEVATQLKPYCKEQVIVSIAAGIRARDISRWLGDYDKIVRCMPNTPAMIGRGVSGLFALPGVSEAQRTVAQDLMSAVGDTVWLDGEAQMDAVTAVSGSGPAYVFYFIEALQQAGVELGLNEAQARTLALATFAGASQLAAQSTEPIQALRERVTSKGGTTFAALTSMNESAVNAAVIRAVKAAAQCGKELGDEFGNQIDDKFDDKFGDQKENQRA
jgi:pyrroline-5-carboxylate reductase